MIERLLGAFAGLLGGLSLSFFYQPVSLHKFGQFTAGAIIGGISVAMSFTLSGAICQWLGLDMNNIDTIMSIGFTVGLMGVGTIGFIANFFHKREGKDVIEIVSEIHETKNRLKQRKPQQTMRGKRNVTK